MRAELHAGIINRKDLHAKLQSQIDHIKKDLRNGLIRDKTQDIRVKVDALQKAIDLERLDIRQLDKRVRDVEAKKVAS